MAAGPRVAGSGTSVTPPVDTGRIQIEPSRLLVMTLSAPLKLVVIWRRTSARHDSSSVSWRQALMPRAALVAV
jgi:hypothetical protein